MLYVVLGSEVEHARWTPRITPAAVASHIVILREHVVDMAELPPDQLARFWADAQRAVSDQVSEKCPECPERSDSDEYSSVSCVQGARAHEAENPQKLRLLSGSMPTIRARSKDSVRAHTTLLR
ncbi:hypothetical protein GCM10007198_05650 [Microbacterium aerolatum]|uniref:Uncharacterized protein n=1 Tax=Microbacterium aerolatum TaxID=153731 RepID=A0A511AIJ9_9MICO|nr:hypothetical protein MAE01_17470 [Microbacterium aerolatum]GGB17961.1 hypothetical protein GCM10007198_05650 [Microbacterium aerolatum]